MQNGMTSQHSINYREIRRSEGGLNEGDNRHPERLLCGKDVYDLLQNPLIILFSNANWPCLVQADTSSMENRGCQDCVGNRRQTKLVIVLRFRHSCIDGRSCVDKLLDGNVSVPTLAVEMTRLRRGIFHAVRS